MTASVEARCVVPTMGANFGDIDNDGYLDFYLGTGRPPCRADPNVLFRNHDGKYFVDVTAATGTASPEGTRRRLRDLDGDGQVDIFENIGGFHAGDAYYARCSRIPGTRRTGSV